MIYALNDQDERIHASKAEKGKSYYCPNLDCGNRELIVKKGKVRIPHFAHRSQKDCSFEPESEAHIMCKTFFQSLLDLGEQFVEYYGIEGVRPDVLYNQFALEIQCSPITVTEVKRRNKIYEKNGYIAIWIFLEDQFISKTKKVWEDHRRSWDFQTLKKHGLVERARVKTEAFKESKPYYRIKKPALRASFQDIDKHNYKIFNFKCENEAIHVNFSDYAGIEVYNEFTKENEIVINNKQDFVSFLEEILILINNKKELSSLAKKLNSLPKQIQANMFESSNLKHDHLSAGDFLVDDNYYRYHIGTFIDDMFRKKDCSMEAFKKYIETLIIKASTKEKEIEDWRNQNTLERNGKKYVPVCRIEKINHERPKSYKVFYNQWIPKSVSFKDDKYLYCEEWWYQRIENGFKEK